MKLFCLLWVVWVHWQSGFVNLIIIFLCPNVANQNQQFNDNNAFRTPTTGNCFKCQCRLHTFLALQWNRFDFCYCFKQKLFSNTWEDCTSTNTPTKVCLIWWPASVCIIPPRPARTIISWLPGQFLSVFTLCLVSWQFFFITTTVARLVNAACELAKFHKFWVFHHFGS